MVGERERGGGGEEDADQIGEGGGGGGEEKERKGCGDGGDGDGDGDDTAGTCCIFRTGEEELRREEDWKGRGEVAGSRKKRWWCVDLSSPCSLKQPKKKKLGKHLLLFRLTLI